MVWNAIDRTKLTPPETSEVIGESLRKEIDSIMQRFPEKQGGLLPTLQLIQKQKGYISDAVILELAVIFKLSPAAILDTITMYSHLYTKPTARHIIMVCHGISCDICGAANLIGKLEKTLGIKSGESTPDGRFMLIEEDCIGHCEKAPCMLIDEECVGPVDPDELNDILGKFL
jgi:NADH-quinone oxidoreductase subunit E